MKAVKTLIATITTLLIFFIIFDGLIVFGVFNTDFLMKKYDKYAVAEQLSMTDDDLYLVTDRLVKYVHGKEESLQIRVSVRGKENDFYDETDISHMVDVRVIITTMRDLFVLSVFTMFHFMAYLGINKAMREFRNGVLIADGLLILFAAAVVIAANVDLDWLIVFCHHIFFNNSNWLLDPAVDNLIFLCPEELFVDSGIFVGAFLIGAIVLITVLSIILTQILPRKSRPRSFHR
jgi:integral membrane protein (TIGR01906 family)